MDVLSVQVAEIVTVQVRGTPASAGSEPDKADNPAG